jgi:putative ABC transport system ATP-binding protein
MLGQDDKDRLPGEPAAMLELVRLRGVHKVYGQGLAGVHALQDIHLQLSVGDIVAVCGPSGCGKTSLLNLVGMLDSASEGTVVIGRMLLGQLSEPARADLRADLIGHVFQSATLIPVLSALDNVMLPLLLRRQLDRDARAVAAARAAELLARLGLATQVQHRPARLDASQSQRVAIARALMLRPRLVVADEPTSRLDSTAVRMVMDLFAQQQQQHGTAFLISTRDQRQLSRVTRTLQMAEGRLATPVETVRKPLRVLT